MKVIISAPTAKELVAVQTAVEAVEIPGSFIELAFHVSGVGMLASCFSLTQLIYEQHPDFIIQIGIAGCFKQNLLNTVVAVKYEYIGDMGVEEEDIFQDAFDMGLAEKDRMPFVKKRLYNYGIGENNLLALDEVVGISVNEITTRPGRISQLKWNYSADIETMEGAAMHYVGTLCQTPFIQLRAVSNLVGERNKANWRMDDALCNLRQTLASYLTKLVHQQLSKS